MNEYKKESMEKTANYVVELGKKILKKHVPSTFIIFGIARGGIPVARGLNIFFKKTTGKKVPYFIIPVNPEHGFHFKKFEEIREKYPNKYIFFIDGWTGGGKCKRNIDNAMKKEGVKDYSFGVILDIAGVADYYVTQKDYLLPWATDNPKIHGMKRYWIDEKGRYRTQKVRSLEGWIFRRKWKKTVERAVEGVR